MLFNSLQFLIFFPVVALLYYVLPHKVRYIWLLVASYFFYMCWNPKYALLMAFSTVSTYTAGLFISKCKATNWKKLWVGLSFTVNIAILFFFKYFDFAVNNINACLSAWNLELINPSFDVILPVGISFYTFQALGYTVDVYRKDIAPEKNLLRYALFVSFFPQLVAGPIERSGNLITQLRERHYFKTENVANGLMLMLWGFFEKLVIADRAAYIVDTVYNNYASYTGFAILIATILFAFQIYCDFASYSDIARGAALVMGFNLMKNFDTPYFSQSVSEFWRRWHISLSSWFRDYLYIPLGGNRKGRVRKYFNLMVVFVLSGLWHGASWTFVIWGGLNGLYQIIGDMTKKLRLKVSSAIGVRRGNFSGKLGKALITFALIDFSWIFFRANSLHDAVRIIKNLFCEFNPWIFTDGTLFTLGLDRADMFVLLMSLVVLLVVSSLKYVGINIREKLSEQGLWFRFAIYFAGLFAVLILGIYGPEYDASQFIYFQF
ncbi:MAG: MBOAT family protein [Clostridia bacterium]|nr:MBOAT family protein [Clostridia bacterium]